MGVDGWGRPYDVVAACARLGRRRATCCRSRGSPTTGARAPPARWPTAWATRWSPRWRWPAAGSTPPPHRRRPLGALAHPVRTRPPPRRASTDRVEAGRTVARFARGQWGIALLSRLPVGDVEVISARPAPPRLGPAGGHPRAPPSSAGGPLVICGTHMSHITHGSHAQYRRLAKQASPGGEAACLAGDMNLWGPPTVSYFRGWRRGGHRSDLAGPPAAQPARPRPGHRHRSRCSMAASADFCRIRPPTGGGHPHRRLASDVGRPVASGRRRSALPSAGR